MSALYKTGTVAWIQIAEDSEWILAYARDYTWVYLLAGKTRLGNGSISPLTAPLRIQIVHLPDDAATACAYCGRTFPMHDNNDCQGDWSDATEPEDTDDVEPEPLKEGDAVLVWARVDNAEPDNEGDLHFDAGGNNYSGFYLPSDSDAIVRPSVGQVPPWVKRAPLTIDPNDEDGAVAELAHAIAEHCGVSVTFADLAKALAERSAAEGGAS